MHISFNKILYKQVIYFTQNKTRKIKNQFQKFQ